MKYEILLMDLDDTLLDFRANEKLALRRLFESFGYELNKHTLATYNTVNKALWASSEQGKVSLTYVLNNRFSDTMKLLGAEIDGFEWEEEYRQLLAEGFQTIEGAKQVCRQLSRNHRLFVITNGITQTQLARIKGAKLDGFFEGVFISQEIGFQKPSVGYFEAVSKGISGFSKEKALVVGDSLSSDIKGGNDFGLDTCHFAPRGKSCGETVKSTFTISRLKELIAIANQ